MGGTGERIHHFARALRLGVAQVEGLPVEPWLMGYVIQRGADVVDRDDVGVAELRPDQREPPRQVVPGQLDRGEEVVRAVDLVHLAGLRVPHHDRRAVDAPRSPRLVAGDLLGLELRPVVGVIELLPLVEHVLAEKAPVKARGRDRGHVVKATDLERVGKLDCVPRALDVRDPVGLVVGGHVVDRREVEEVVDLR